MDLRQVETLIQRPTPAERLADLYRDKGDTKALAALLERIGVIGASCQRRSRDGRRMVRRWTHVAVTYDAATQQGVLYIDGEAKSWTGRPDFGTPTGLQSSNDELLIGAEIEPIEQFFNGRIDDVRIYAETLTASEIQALAADAP